ncbi:TCP-1/cpn60 chaperonin family protein [Babesia bovis T2Bo]|uniref:Chaperonin cpn60, putative n=1 Tax=Babesia bovis TaxID=5865 RepID=A7AR88_BABBO|nr:TCP-1/cpn60 chaperonin family protein [Babesia bovis T2Bo]EDO07057.1 TCP-1/cpn60 chaperonin family protein [Babesia bovis T2Bo]|eukprot:XP_001610625.1 chaperonin cpn60 [Babesia bovis T2Bo]
MASFRVFAVCLLGLLSSRALAVVRHRNRLSVGHSFHDAEQSNLPSPNEAFTGSAFIGAHNSGSSSFYSRGFRSNSSSLSAKPKEIILHDECRNNLLAGVSTVADTVRVTLGPRGRNVLLEKEFGSPIIVNDGVTIARNIELEDRKINVGAKLIQEIASASDDRAGDGTTSTSILAAEIAKKGVDYVNKGHNPIPIQKGIQKTSKLIIEELKSLSKPVNGYKDLLNIATVATSGNVVMGEVIARAFDKLGANAATVLEENPALEDQLDFTEGYTFERGFANPYFLLGEEKDTIEWTAPQILISDGKIESAQSVLPILEHAAKTKTPLVIIAEDFGPDAMQTFIINKMRGMLKVVAVKAPSFGERRKDYLQDIATATGSTFVSQDVGISFNDLTVDMLGMAKNVVIKKDRTSILTLPQFNDVIKKRIQSLLSEKERSTSSFDKQKLNERIAALSGGIARIRIGAATETELKEKRLRYEDAINAVRAAMETGFVPGGGVAYLAMQSPEFTAKAERHINDTVTAEMRPSDPNLEGEKADDVESEIALQQAGAKIVLDAMSIITQQIADNAGANGAKVVERIKSSGKPFGYGWNAKTNSYGDMIQQGVIDPTKVVMNAVENASSVAGLILTTEGMMVEKETEKKKGVASSIEDAYE